MNKKVVISLTLAVASGALVVFALLFALLPAQDNNSPYAVNSNQIVLVATNTIIADALKHITQGIKAKGIPLYRIHTMASYGLDPHSYRITRQDRIMAIQSSAIFYSGLGLEIKLANMLTALDFKAICMSDGISSNEFIYERYGADSNSDIKPKSDEHKLKFNPMNKHNLEYDPHIWLNPALWQHAIQHASSKLQQLDQKSAHIVKKRADEYISKMLAVHNRFKEIFATLKKPIPIIVQHNSFGYIAKEYNLDIRYLLGANADSQVSYKRLMAVVQAIIANNIKYIFTNTLTDRYSFLMHNAAERLGHKTYVAGPLLVDSVGRPHTVGSGYIGMLVYDFLYILESSGFDTKTLKHDTVLGEYYVDIPIANN